MLQRRLHYGCNFPAFQPVLHDTAPWRHCGKCHLPPFPCTQRLPAAGGRTAPPGYSGCSPLSESGQETGESAPLEGPGSLAAPPDLCAAVPRSERHRIPALLQKRYLWFHLLCHTPCPVPESSRSWACARQRHRGLSRHQNPSAVLLPASEPE